MGRLPLVTSARPIVYSDLNCPFCFTLNEWLEQGGWGAEVRWVGVEHEPAITLPPGRGAEAQALLDSEVAAVRGRAPEVGVVRPPMRPNTRLALSALELLTARNREHARKLRGLLFRALWREGIDISDRSALAVLLSGFDVGLAELDQAAGAVAEHTATWRARGWNRIPVIEAATGTTYMGLGERRLLEVFMGSALFDVDRGGSCEVSS